MKKQLIILALIAFVGTMVFGRDKIVTIGHTDWYTEQNTFEEMLKIATKENKPIFAVFSATWCGPCQIIKKTVFKHEDFKKVKDEAVLLYVEQTEKSAIPYIEKYKINIFPSFRIFAKDGTLLDSNVPGADITSFLKWVKDVKSGNNYYEISKQVKANPNNRELKMKLVDRCGHLNTDEKFQLLREVIKQNPDINDPLTHKAHEDLANTLHWDLYNQRSEKKKEYAEKHKEEFMKSITPYYPDNFKYALKKANGFTALVTWNNVLGQFKEADACFNVFMKKHGDTFNVIQNFVLLKGVILTRLHLGRVKDAEALLEKMKEAGKNLDPADKNSKYYSMQYKMLVDTFVQFYKDKGQIDTAEKYANIIINKLKAEGKQEAVDRSIQMYKSFYGLFKDDK